MKLSFEKFTLSNGLDVILHQDHLTPVVAVNVWYHVGSKNESPGRTGFAHLFEHIMFEGSEHHNSSFFEPLQAVGGTLNGSTTVDRTNYWENVPSDYLELALWLESDRMGYLLEALDERRFDTQREVVKNERRQSYENRPYGLAGELIDAAFFPPSHPYHWPTIGSMEDLNAASLQDVKEFFRRFYRPANASLAVCGDIRLEETRRLIEHYFAELEPGPPLSRMARWVPTLASEVRLAMEDRVQLPRLYLTWPAPPHLDREEAPLDILASILGQGKSSRLYRTLVHERQIAQEVRAFNQGAEIAGQFSVLATASPGHTLRELESAVQEQIERLQTEGPTEEEIVQARNRVEARFIRQLERLGGFGGRADLFNQFNVFAGDPGAVNQDVERYLAVQPAEVREVARRYLGEGRVLMQVTPIRAATSVATGVNRAVEPSPGEASSFVPPTPRRRKLSNGLELLVVEKHELPVVDAVLHLRAGSTGDPQERPGLAYLTGRMLSEGTTTRSSEEIARGFESIGSQLEVFTGRETTIIATRALTKHWPRALELLADVVQNPSFPEQELSRVRRQHLTELARLKDEPAATAERLLPGLLYGQESPYGHPSDGTEPSLQALTVEDLRQLYRRHYQPSAATLILVGDSTLDEAASAMEFAFGEWQDMGEGAPEVPATFPPAPSTTTIYLVDKPGAAQSVLRSAQRTISRKHSSYLSLNLLNYIFGAQPLTARLDKNLRETKGYSYGYRSRIEWGARTSTLSAGGAVQTAVTKEALIETLREFAEITSERPVEEAEFAAGKESLLRGYPNSFETPGQIAQQIAQLVSFSLPDDYFVTLLEELQAVSLADVRQVARVELDSEHLTVLVVGDRAKVEAGLRELGLPLYLIDPYGRPVS